MATKKRLQEQVLSPREQAERGLIYGRGPSDRLTPGQIPSEGDWINPGNIWASVQSSNVAGIMYDFDHRKLYVEFKDGSRYVYHAVQPTTAQDMYRANSFGKFIHFRLKGKYAYEKVN